MKDIITSFHNIKYKTENLKKAIIKKGYYEEFEEELYDVNIALEYINEMIKKYTNDGRRGSV